MASNDYTDYGMRHYSGQPKQNWKSLGDLFQNYQKRGTYDYYGGTYDGGQPTGNQNSAYSQQMADMYAPISWGNVAMAGGKGVAGSGSIPIGLAYAFANLLGQAYANQQEAQHWANIENLFTEGQSIDEGISQNEANAYNGYDPGSEQFAGFGEGGGYYGDGGGYGGGDMGFMGDSGPGPGMYGM